MKKLNRENVLDALRIVKDPDLHRDIVSLNFVK
ncbi:MAG: iron-sulfur cluster assembly protein, partial [Bacteroidota bacterium]